MKATNAISIPIFKYLDALCAVSLFCDFNINIAEYRRSGDIVFDYSIIHSCMNEHIINGNDITVVLNKKSKYYKHWRFVMDDNNVVTKFIYEKEPQPYERYFIILNREVLDRYSYKLKNDKSFDISQNSIYGSGASFLLKNLFDMGEKITCITRRNVIVNVNTPNDINTAKSIISKHLKNQSTTNNE